MKAPKGKVAIVYRALAGILGALLLLSLPANAAWKPMAPPPVPNLEAAVDYVAGGRNSTNPELSTLQAFNPETNTWTALANMPIVLMGGNGAGVINSQLYVAGGWSNACCPTNTLLMYDPPSNTWTTLAPMSHLSACGGTGVINSKLTSQLPVMDTADITIFWTCTIRRQIAGRA